MSNMKKCGTCNRIYPLNRLVCLECGEVFENRPYLIWIAITMICGVLLELGFRYFAGVGGSLLKEAFVNQVALLLICYPTWKLYQKQRDKGRAIMAEMGSVFSERFDRILYFCLGTGLLFFSPRIVSVLMSGGPGLPGSPAWYGLFLQVRHCFVMIAAPIVLAAILLDQGRNFFNPKIGSVYYLRELVRLCDSEMLPQHQDPPFHRDVNLPS